MKKRTVLSLDLENDIYVKRKGMKTVATHPGIDEVTIDSKAKTLTIIGTVDPVEVVCKLRKKGWVTSIISVGPVPKPVEQSKKNEDQSKKKEEQTGEPIQEKEPNKEPKKVTTPKKGKGKKEEAKEEEQAQSKKGEGEVVIAPPTLYNQYYASLHRSFSVSHSMEENPNACVIC